MNRTITINDNMARLAEFVSELVRQGVAFTVTSEEIYADMQKTVTVWHVKLPGGF